MLLVISSGGRAYVAKWISAMYRMLSTSKHNPESLTPRGAPPVPTPTEGSVNSS